MAKPARLKNLHAVADTGSDPAAAPLPVKVAEGLYKAFEGLCLTPYQARVMVALQQVGSGICVDLARLAGVPRSSIYQVLEELDGRGLAYRVPGNGPAVWASVGRQEALDRLVQAEADRLEQLKVHAAEVAKVLERLLPSDRSVSLPYVQVIHDPSRVAPLYEQLLSQTEDELLVFNRPPYTKPSGIADSHIIATVRRVGARVLYQAAQVEDPGYDNWHDEMAHYHQAGAEGRVVNELPIKLAIFDRRSTLVSLDDPVLPQVGFPITLLIEHPGYSSVQAHAFENMWATAAPYAEVRQRFEADRHSKLA